MQQRRVGRSECSLPKAATKEAPHEDHGGATAITEAVEAAEAVDPEVATDPAITEIQES